MEENVERRDLFRSDATTRKDSAAPYGRYFDTSKAYPKVLKH